MFLPDLVVRSRRVVTARGTRAAAVHIRGGRVIGIADFDDVPAGCAVDEADGVVLPGIVDTRVQVQADAPAEADAFRAATQAAAAGGVTTIVDMPFGDGAATITVQALEDKRRRARGACWADVGFWAGAVAGNTRDLQPLFEAGVFGFACVARPRSDPGSATVTEADLRTVMPGLRNLGATLLVHAAHARELESRSKAAESEGIALVAELCRQYRTTTHIVHLSSSDALTPLFHARAARLPISAETCPHYLNLVADEVTADAAALLQGAPPIRERENREFLWAALAHGLLQMTVADRFTPLELGLSTMWTGASGRSYPLERIAEWMSAAPARLAGLTRKGRIDVGYDADLVVFQPDIESPAESLAIRSRHAYRGVRLRGRVERTYLRGVRTYSRRDGWVSSPPGTLIARSAV